MRFAFRAFCRNIAQMDSARVYPEASSSNTRQKPSVDKILMRKKLIVVYGCNKRFVPQTKALSHCPVRMAVNAESSAKIPLLHAVSMANEGPSKPKEYEMLWNLISRLN